MEKLIIYSDVALISLSELVDALFEEEYFGFKQSAIEYTLKIVDYIDLESSYYIEYTSPKTHKKYGDYFLKYKAIIEQLGIFFMIKQLIGYL